MFQEWLFIFCCYVRFFLCCLSIVLCCAAIRHSIRFNTAGHIYSDSDWCNEQQKRKNKPEHMCAMHKRVQCNTFNAYKLQFDDFKMSKHTAAMNWTEQAWKKNTNHCFEYNYECKWKCGCMYSHCNTVYSNRELLMASTWCNRFHLNRFAATALLCLFSSGIASNAVRHFFLDISSKMYQLLSIPSEECMQSEGRNDNRNSEQKKRQIVKQILLENQFVEQTQMIEIKKTIAHWFVALEMPESKSLSDFCVDSQFILKNRKRITAFELSASGVSV